jgi:hypothetical protein
MFQEWFVSRRSARVVVLGREVTGNASGLWTESLQSVIWFLSSGDWRLGCVDPEATNGLRFRRRGPR